MSVMQSLDFVYHLYDYRPKLDSSQSYYYQFYELFNRQRGRAVRVLR